MARTSRLPDESSPQQGATTSYVMVWKFACTNACMEYATSLDMKNLRNHCKPCSWCGVGLRVFAPHVANGRGERFPAISSHQSAVDKDLLNLLRAVMNHGVRQDTISDIVKELHSIDYILDRWLIKSPDRLLAKRLSKKTNPWSANKGACSPTFQIKAGTTVPSLWAVTFSTSCEDEQVNWRFISTEGIKWPVSGLGIDTISYYVTQILVKYHVAKMYDGLFSGTFSNLGHLLLQPNLVCKCYKSGGVPTSHCWRASLSCRRHLVILCHE